MLCIILTLLFSSLTTNADVPFHMNLSNNLVNMHTHFLGDKIWVFGTTPANHDIIIRVVGPAQTINRQKQEKKGPFWLPGTQDTFKNVPSFYKIMSNRPLSDSLSAKDFKNLGHITPHPSLNQVLLKQSRKRYKIKNNLHNPNPYGFYTKFSLPTDARPGLYTVEAFCLKNKHIVHHQTAPLHIQQVGLDRFLTRLAYGNSWLYGLFCVILVLLLAIIMNMVYGRIFR
jgi:hypothetical protein